MKTTIEIADPLLKQAKALAAKERLTLRILIEEGLRFALEARTKTSPEKFRLRDGSFRGKGLRPGVQWTDLAALAYDEESRYLRT